MASGEMKRYGPGLVGAQRLGREVGAVAQLRRPPPWDNADAPSGPESLVVSGRPVRIIEAAVKESAGLFCNIGEGNALLSAIPPSLQLSVFGLFFIEGADAI